MKKLMTTLFKKKILSSEAGMSLIEILIVITLIATVGAMIANRVLDNADRGKYQSGKILIETIASKLEDYKLRCGQYPDSLKDMMKGGGNGCEEFPKQGFLKEDETKDPWKNELIYTKNGSEYSLKSLGADKAEGGEGYNKDISTDQE